MTQSGNDGANLVEGGAKLLLTKWLPKTARLVIEADAARDGSGRILLRILQEPRPDGVDGPAVPGA